MRMAVTIGGVLRRLRVGELTVEKVVGECLRRATLLNPKCNAIVRFGLAANVERTLADAAAATERYRRGVARPLEGIPIIIKDNITTTDFLTTCCSRVLEDYTSPFDAHAVQLLRDSGALILGKSNMDEFGMGSYTETSIYGPTKQENGFLSGGSSGGSAVSVQSGMALGALGSDTGGSIIFPAALCSVYGLRPSYGVVSRFGLVPYAHSFDTIGPMANSIDDLKLLFNIISSKRDSRDMTNTTKLSSPSDSELKEKLSRKIRIGVPSQLFHSSLMTGTARASLKHALDEFRLKKNAQIVDIQVPSFTGALAAYYLLACSEVSSNLAQYDGLRYGKPSSVLGKEARRRIKMGRRLLFSNSNASCETDYLDRASALRMSLRLELEKCFNAVDLIALPCAQKYNVRQHEEKEEDISSDVFTVVAGLSGIPSLVLPFAISKDKFAAVQILSRHGGDLDLLEYGTRLDLAESSATL